MDAIGQFTFVRLDKAPERVGAQWEIASVAGIDGVSLWNSGNRGQPFTLMSEAVALSYAAGRTFLKQYKSLELAGPVSIVCGVLENDQLYKVLSVNWHGPGVKRVARAHIGGDTTTYGAIVWATWSLLPIDPFVQSP